MDALTENLAGVIRDIRDDLIGGMPKLPKKIGFWSLPEIEPWSDDKVTWYASRLAAAFRLAAAEQAHRGRRAA